MCYKYTKLYPMNAINNHNVYVSVCDINHNKAETQTLIIQFDKPQ